MGHSRFRSAKIRCKMRSLRWLGAMAIGFALAVPASAQVTIQFGGPRVSGFSNSYPWFNDMPQYRGDQSFRYFLAYHPNIAYALSRDPGLLYDAEWRSQYPELEDYMANHPYAWQALNNEDWATGPAETQWGSYDDQNQWRDAYWWHQNDASWFYDNHQDWASLDSRWLNEDGAYDPQNQWHYGEWWYNQNPGWVTSNHPLWLQQHRNWASASEQQSFRQRMATPAQNPVSRQRAIDQQQVRPVAGLELTFACQPGAAARNNHHCVPNVGLRARAGNGIGVLVRRFLWAQRPGTLAQRKAQSPLRQAGVRFQPAPFGPRTKRPARGRKCRAFRTCC